MKHVANNKFADYTPQEIANFFIARAVENKVILCPMKMLKLVYYAYAWYYVVFEKTLFEEKVEAWDHGPVVPSLYHEFKRFGGDKITALATSFEDDQIMHPFISKPRDDEQDKIMTINLLDLVWKEYGKSSAWSLRNKTHEEGSPWCAVYEKSCNNVIEPNQVMKDYHAPELARLLGTIDD